MDDLEDFVMRRLPTPDRPLLGLTVLAVEDSRFACEAMRLMCLRSGARIRRADSLKAAARHLRIYCPSVAIVDLGLPDGPGTSLIRELAEAGDGITAIIGTSGDDGAREQAIDAGAHGFLAKPVNSLAEFQACILEHLPQEVQPKGLRVVPDDVLEPDTIAFRDDLSHAAELITRNAEGATLDYVAQFLSGVSKSAGDNTLLSAAHALHRSRRGTGGTGAAISQLMSLLKDRLARRAAV